MESTLPPIPKPATASLPNAETMRLKHMPPTAMMRMGRRCRNADAEDIPGDLDRGREVAKAELEIGAFSE